MTTWHLYCALHLGRLVVLGPCCTDAGCSRVATWRTFWPGQTSVKCTAHRDGWARIAAAMGFVMQSRPLDIDPVGDASEVRFQQMELE